MCSHPCVYSWFRSGGFRFHLQAQRIHNQGRTMLSDVSRSCSIFSNEMISVSLQSPCSYDVYHRHSGKVVGKDCTAGSGTRCIPCETGTYMNKPNGLNSCFSCSSCDSGSGLSIKQNCTSKSDTVCDVLHGYFCKSWTDSSGCSTAAKHSACKPGQRIKHPDALNAKLRSKKEAQRVTLSAVMDQSDTDILCVPLFLA
ncbi:PREDICTED: tumor necrosis factor receptor superfamily member 6-like [Cyprinodon variegatus]|uniref:tumor necrosis factor receptor superfamily member 6-like n=1 Tax=Cyprinodon variegatus TaxID=28743 RepID=UPI000742B904|nr:PREDICTED: tumor necrosis factor receptor superfamily member 6-like [Cyprinodon variegatus]